MGCNDGFTQVEHVFTGRYDLDWDGISKSLYVLYVIWRVGIVLERFK